MTFGRHRSSYTQQTAILFNVIRSVCAVNRFVNKGDVYIVKNCFLFLALLFFNWCCFWHEHIKIKKKLCGQMLFPWKRTRSFPKGNNEESHVMSLSKTIQASVLSPSSCPPSCERRAGPPVAPVSVRRRRPRWEWRSSADQTRSPAGSHPWRDTDKWPGCVCTGGEEHRREARWYVRLRLTSTPPWPRPPRVLETFSCLKMIVKTFWLVGHHS